MCFYTCNTGKPIIKTSPAIMFEKTSRFCSYLPTQQNNSMIIVFGDISTDFLINLSNSSSKDMETQILASVNNQNLHWASPRVSTLAVSNKACTALSSFTDPNLIKLT